MGADFNTRELTVDEFSEWDRLVENSPQGTIFNTTDWLKICAETWRGKLRIWGCFRNDELVGGCALRVLNFVFLRRAANSSMMTPYNGVVLKALPKETKLRRIEHFYNNVINSLCHSLEQLNSVRLVFSPDYLDIRPFIRRKWVSKMNYTYVLSLSDAKLNHFTKNVKYNIRKAEKHDIRVERSNDGLKYFDLYKTMLLRKNALPPTEKLKYFFQRIVELLNQKNLGELWFAKTPTDEIAAGEIFVFYKKTAYEWTAASRGDYLHTGAPSFLIFEIIKYLKDRFNELDMGGADIPELHRISAEFSPMLVPYYTVEKSSLIARAGYAIIKKVYERVR